MENISCAICGLDDTALLFSKWDYNIVMCRRCELTYVNPRNVNVEADDYFSGPYLSTIEENGILKPDIERIYSGIIANLNTYLTPCRLLDVGCAMGHFMVHARQYGWNVHGVECSPYAAESGRQRWGLRVQPVCDLRDAHFPENHFDACVLIEVAEHLPYPRVTFTETFRLLKPGGMLYITTPNFASFRSLLRREEWHPVIPTGHLYYFTGESLGKLLTSIGFSRLVNLTPPALFDSEVELARTAGLPLAQAELERIRQKTAREDATKLSNARGEGLVVCAIKPCSADDAIVASLRSFKTMPALEGRLVRARGERVEDHRVYLIREGQKHWVSSVDWLHNNGRRLEETIQVEPEVLDSIFQGSPLG